MCQLFLYKINDVHQLITYLYIQSAENNICGKAGVVYPIEANDSDKESYNEVGKLMGFGATLYKWGLKIPKESMYNKFTNAMKENEIKFIDKKKP